MACSCNILFLRTATKESDAVEEEKREMTKKKSRRIVLGEGWGYSVQRSPYSNHTQEILVRFYKKEQYLLNHYRLVLEEIR